jgi:hypothetical protein
VRGGLEDLQPAQGLLFLRLPAAGVDEKEVEEARRRAAENEAGGLLQEE